MWKPHPQNTPISSLLNTQRSEKQIPLGMALIKRLNRTGSEKDTLSSIWVVHQLWTCGNCSEHLPKAAGLEESREQLPCSSGFPLQASLPAVKIHSVPPFSYYIVRVWEEKQLFCQLQSFSGWKLLNLWTLENSGDTGNKPKNKISNA